MAVRPLSTVLKTLAVLDALAKSSRPLRLIELAQQTDEARGAVYQRLVTLVEAGWIDALEDGTYRLSLRTVPFANVALEQADLGARFTDILQDIVTETSETASLAVLDGTDALIIQRVEAAAMLRADLRVGARLELARTALGRSLTSHATPEKLEFIRGRKVALPSEEVMRQVRKQGYSVSVVTGPRTVSAVASAVFDNRKRCVAAISISGPNPGFDAARCTKAVVAAAARINARMGLAG